MPEADVRGALARQGMAESDILPGDAIFFHYGWAAHWGNPKVYGASQPGIGLEVFHRNRESTLRGVNA